MKSGILMNLTNLMIFYSFKERQFRYRTFRCLSTQRTRLVNWWWTSSPRWLWVKPVRIPGEKSWRELYWARMETSWMRWKSFPLPLGPNASMVNICLSMETHLTVITFILKGFLSEKFQTDKKKSGKNWTIFRKIGWIFAPKIEFVLLEI